MLHINELNINEYIGFAESHVGKTYDLGFQTDSKYGEKAGTFTIVSFEALENPAFGYSYWKYEENQTPNHAKLGYYRVRFDGTKFYNGKTIKVKVTAYVQDEKIGKTKALHISNVNEETGKSLKAYSFGILDFRVKA